MLRSRSVTISTGGLGDGPSLSGDPADERCGRPAAGLASPWAYLLVGLLAAAEAAAFVGLVIPGETAMLLGGVLVAGGNAHLGGMLAAAMVGAVGGGSLADAVRRDLPSVSTVVVSPRPAH